MIATPSIKTRLLKPFLVLALMVGALFCAPAVSAYSGTPNEDFPDVFQTVCEEFNLDSSECSYIGFYTVRNNNALDVAVFVYPEGTVPSIGLEPELRSPYKINVYPTNGYVYDGSRNRYTSLNDARNFSIPCAFVENGVVNFPCPAPMYGDYEMSSLSDVYYYVSNYWPDYFNTLAAAVSYDVVAVPIDTTSQTYADSMLQEYLHSEGFTPDMASAWLIAPSGQPTQIPLSYTTPTNYNGDIWVQLQNATPYLDKFTPRFSDNFNAVDYQGYKLSISYDIDVSYVKLYALTGKQYSFDYDFNLYINDTIRQDSSSTLPQTKGYYTFDGVTYFGSLYEQDNGSQNGRELLYCIWDFNPAPAAAIPQLVPLYCALDIRTVDNNGDTVISRESNDYRQFVTNYNQKAISGLTGTYIGSTFSKQDWRGQSVSQNVDYSNDFSISYDSNLGEVFQTIFTMGNGHVLTLCIGGLSIAFAAYVLFGKH